MPSINVPVEPDKVRQLKVYVTQPPIYLEPGEHKFQIIAADSQSYETDVYSATFEVPEQK